MQVPAVEQSFRADFLPGCNFCVSRCAIHDFNGGRSGDTLTFRKAAAAPGRRSDADDGDVLQQVRDRLQQNKEHAQRHDRLDRPEERRPGGVVLLGVGHGVVRAGNPAEEQDGKEEDDEEDGDRIGERPVAGRHAVKDQVHADMGAELHGIGATQEVIGRQHELGHLKRPVDRHAEHQARQGRPQQHGRHREDQMHREPADGAVHGIDAAHE